MVTPGLPAVWKGFSLLLQFSLCWFNLKDLLRLSQNRKIPLDAPWGSLALEQRVPSRGVAGNPSLPAPARWVKPWVLRSPTHLLGQALRAGHQAESLSFDKSKSTPLVLPMVRKVTAPFVRVLSTGDDTGSQPLISRGSAGLWVEMCSSIFPFISCLIFIFGCVPSIHAGAWEANCMNNVCLSGGIHAEGFADQVHNPKTLVPLAINEL